MSEPKPIVPTHCDYTHCTEPATHVVWAENYGIIIGRYCSEHAETVMKIKEEVKNND
jgi:hypothetical protein